MKLMHHCGTVSGTPPCAGKFGKMYARIIAAVTVALVFFPATAEELPAFEKDIRPLVVKYCFGCHNAEKSVADLNIERFETTGMVQDSIALWKRIGMRVQNKEMPPKDQPRPTDEERAVIAAWIDPMQADPNDCNQIANEESVSWYPGYVMSRRLNRHEYENSVRDLLGIDVELADIFPADGAGGEGFDNNGNALFLSAIQLEKYLDAADMALAGLFPQRARTSPRAGAHGRESFAAQGTKPTAAERRLDDARDRLVPETPKRRGEVGRMARGVIENFLTRAWRRPVEAEEIDRLMTVFDRAYKRGDGYEASLALAFKAALVSPNFLFLAEPEPDKPGVYELDGYRMAARLSYFLWASMPDEELVALADLGALADPKTLEEQVRRMLQDPKAAALGDIFATQWLGITQLGETTKPDPKRFPEFDETLADTMRAEVASFFGRIVTEDRSLLELIDADYTFVNDRLAAIYGLGDVTGSGMQLVHLDDPNRGGVLGMAAVLTATSHPLRTSPVLRGKWVLEQLLGEGVPPPPPGVEAIPEDDIQPDGLTLRARMEAHRERAECASCHARMDPIGFGLENFDPIGRWRNEQAGQPVDAQGVLPSGETFSGPKELKSILMKRKDDVARNLSRKMLGYALGRSLTQYDDCIVTDCVEALQQNDYRISHLFTQIVLSYPFRHRYSGGEKDDPSAGDTD